MAAALSPLEAGVGVSLQYAAEILEVLLRMKAPTIGRVGEPDRRRRFNASRAIIANIGPESSGLGPATPWRQHRNRRVVGMKLGTGHDMPANSFNEGCKQPA